MFFNHPLKAEPPEGFESAQFALGCFWGAERKFWENAGNLVKQPLAMRAVKTLNPNYPEVCTGKTGHTETVMVVYNPAIISYERLLTIFWEAHNPTEGMRQGNDVGTQYRSAIFYHQSGTSFPRRDVKNRIYKGSCRCRVCSSDHHGDHVGWAVLLCRSRPSAISCQEPRAGIAD